MYIWSIYCVYILCNSGRFPGGSRPKWISVYTMYTKYIKSYICSCVQTFRKVRSDSKFEFCVYYISIRETYIQSLCTLCSVQHNIRHDVFSERRDQRRTKGFLVHFVAVWSLSVCVDKMTFVTVALSHIITIRANKGQFVRLGAFSQE